MKFKLQIAIASMLVCFLVGLLDARAYHPTQSNQTIWDVLTQQFTLNHNVDRTEVQRQIRWIVKHPTYINQITSQATPYIHFITHEIQKRNMPGEIALIPMIESGYNPFAYSGVGAAGIWQMMPVTGKDLGLKQDWWADHRRSVTRSTNAALNYLTYLHKLFRGDWSLAVAAYDVGEGKMARALKKNRSREFWRLSLPRETKAYIPRLMALAEIIENPKRYKIHLPDIPDKPYFTEVNVEDQVDLNQAAKLADISYQELIRLNPGYNRWVTPPNKPFTLLIPITKAQTFIRNLARLPKEKQVNFLRHQVKPNESLSSIASNYHTTTTMLKAINQLKSDKLTNNQNIFIPQGNELPVETIENHHAAYSEFIYPNKYRVLHIVDENESLSHIQKKYNVSSEDIKAWNELSENAKLETGQQLIIWKNDNSPRSRLYVVLRGDTLSRIALRTKTSISKLRKLNVGLNDARLKVGQKIKVA